MPDVITIDGRGLTIHDAISEMWQRMQPLEQKGFNPISGVEIVDESTKQIIQTFQLTDPEFQLHLQSDKKEEGRSKEELKAEPPHSPESKGHFRFIARVKLA